VSEVFSAHAAAGINFLLGLVKRRQKLPIFVAPECLKPASPRNEAGLERFALHGWQALQGRFDFLHRAHKLTLVHHGRLQQPLTPGFLFGPARVPGGSQSRRNASSRRLRSERRRSLLAKMAKPNAKKRRVRINRVKGVASRGFFRRRRWVLIGFVILLLIPAMQVAVVRFVNPPRTLPMLIEQGGAIFSKEPKRPLLYHWIDLPQMPEMFLKHLWISEDQRFFQHDGFDWKEMELAVAQAERKGKPVRGASTITNQCARSIFLWQGRSWIRKGLESYYTIWMEALLPKRRILELYANVIEMGRGIYGVEAASQHFFGVSARVLTREQSALLAAVLPNPKGWDPARPGMTLRWRQLRILEREKNAKFPGKLLR
jgi:monofunctional biosynthetic peptidoglycan transglycosylase